MKKQQKIWLGIFLAMFILPELLWSPVENLVYDLLQNSNNVKIFRPNFLTVSDNTYLLLFVLLFQVEIETEKKMYNMRFNDNCQGSI